MSASHPEASRAAHRSGMGNLRPSSGVETQEMEICCAKAVVAKLGNNHMFYKLVRRVCADKVAFSFPPNCDVVRTTPRS